MCQSERIHRFVEEIWQWYACHKRALPWRDLTISDPNERAYRVLVSEIMLQQTQAARVIVIYRRFLRQFPTLRSLARASNRDVIMAWRGMGYNSRALRLRDAARAIVARSALLCHPPSLARQIRRVARCAGNRTARSAAPPVTAVSSGPSVIFPSAMEELLSIPGIGPYTAAAIRNFAFNLPTPCLDTNIRRILHRTFVGPENPDGTWKMSDRYLLDLAREVLNAALPFLAPAEWHAALMDFGSIVQTKNNPKWRLCPLTAAGIMKTKPEQWEKLRARTSNEPTSNKQLREPGRQMSGRFVPNRIFRGRIVEALRDAQSGLALERLGQEICPDWASEHIPWLQSLITKLIQEELLEEWKGRYVLKG